MKRSTRASHEWSRRCVFTGALALALAGCGDRGDNILVAEEAPPVENPDTGTRLEGMFHFLADAPLFRDCRTGKVFPVAMAGPFIELQRAYFNSGITSGEELKVAVHGRFLERPEMESNSSEIMLIIDSFDSILETMDCAPAVQAELSNTYWKLVELGGVMVKPIENAQQIHMVLGTATHRVNGFAGCNNFFGQYRQEGENLAFSGLGSTMMACPVGMDTEQAFLKALGETDRAVVNGIYLQLYSASRPVARLEAVYLP
jgi:copper homeostasis protein (lipoprotein)